MPLCNTPGCLNLFSIVCLNLGSFHIAFNSSVVNELKNLLNSPFLADGISLDVNP